MKFLFLILSLVGLSLNFLSCSVQNKKMGFILDAKLDGEILKITMFNNSDTPIYVDKKMIHGLNISFLDSERNFIFPEEVAVQDVNFSVDDCIMLLPKGKLCRIINLNQPYQALQCAESDIGTRSTYLAFQWIKNYDSVKVIQINFCDDWIQSWYLNDISDAILINCEIRVTDEDG